MGRIKGNINVGLQSGAVIEPGSIITSDIADGNITLPKMASTYHTYTITRSIDAHFAIDSPVADLGNGYWAGFSATSYPDIANIVVPYDSYLRRIDVSVTNADTMLTSEVVQVNFSNSKAGASLLPQGIIIHGGLGGANNFQAFDRGAAHYYPGSMIWISIDVIPVKTQGLQVTFTFERQISE